MTTPKLLPCPECGTAPELEHDTDGGMSGIVVVLCLSCHEVMLMDNQKVTFGRHVIQRVWDSWVNADELASVRWNEGVLDSPWQGVA